MQEQESQNKESDVINQLTAPLLDVPLHPESVSMDAAPEATLHNDSFANLNNPAEEGSPNVNQNDESFSISSPNVISNDQMLRLDIRDQLYLNSGFQSKVAKAAAAGGDGQGSSGGNIIGRFHWTRLMPWLYTTLLLLMSCILGYFTISGGIYFLLFLLHSFAYYGFRDRHDPVDMLSSMRERNKSTTLRQIFKWALLVISSLYLVVLIVGHSTVEYTDIKIMMLDEDHERLRKNQIEFKRFMDKLVPNFLSYWHFLLGGVMLIAAVALFKIQKEEAIEAKRIDDCCAEIYKDIKNVNSQLSSSAQLLSFKPFQVQKCVSILKDFKFKAEIFLFFQVVQLTLIANAQYCLYGLSYLVFAVIQILNIAYSHGRSDQNIREVSNLLTVILLVYLPIDLLLHYWVHFCQESDRIDYRYDEREGEFHLQGYQGIMVTSPSYVTFGLKIGLFVFECLKYEFSYDFGPVYKHLKDTFIEAESTTLPESKILNPNSQQADFLQRQQYNQRLKFQYVKIFKKSSSFVHRIMQPIAVFMTCLTQLLIILGHPSILFIILLGLSVTGFFVSIRDSAGRTSFFIRAKIILGIETVYVICQYAFNVFRVEVATDFQHKEEFLILTGLGTEQQLGYFEDETNIFDSLFPFNLSIVFLLIAAIFTRYVGKPSLQQPKQAMNRAAGVMRRNTGGLTDNSSERIGGTADDEMLTVFDDGMSVSGLSSDIRSHSRRGPRDNMSNIGNEVFHNIIQEDEHEDESDDDFQQPTVEQQQLSQNLVRYPTVRQIIRNSQSPTFETQNKLVRRSNTIKSARNDLERDSTTRGKIRQVFAKIYEGMLKLFDKLVDLSIVHINKFVLLALFIISVQRPTLLNAMLFIMFLVLSMSTHQNEARYLRLTLLINSLAIAIIFSLDTFIQRDYSTIRTWVLTIIGVQYRRENVVYPVVKLKYVPYIVLQCILCLSSYVLESEKYNQFKRQYMDIDTQKKMDIMKQMSLKHNPTEKALSSKLGRSRPAQSRISKSIIDGSRKDGSLKDKSESSFALEGGVQEMMDQTQADVINDETKNNLMKQQELIIMYDPVTKFLIKNGAYFLVFFIFTEIMLLPLSIMNFILLILMTIIVIKMLHCDTRLQTYKSLSNVLLVLSIFVIIYIFTKYMFLFAEYTQNILLKNSIENGYHQSSLNPDGTPKVKDSEQEMQKTEDAKQQLHHSHDHDDPQNTLSLNSKLFEKMFGFKSSEDEKNEGGVLLCFKLLNLAIILSLANLFLNTLKHRNLPYLLGEHESVAKQNKAKQRETERGANIDREEREEKIEEQKIQMSGKIEVWANGWRWWHYTKVYTIFFLWFFLPVMIILFTFTFYPLSSISLPSVTMILMLLVILAIHARPDCWRQSYRSIGALLQLMMCVCYALYFLLIDQMASYDQTNPAERQVLQNKKVLWGLYQTSQVIASEQNGRAEDVPSVFVSIVPLFLILSMCFLYKELDTWVFNNLNLTIHLTLPIKREVLRFTLRENRENKKLNLEIEDALKQDLNEKNSSENDKESISGATLGKQEGGSKEASSKKGEENQAQQPSNEFKDELGNTHSIDEEGNLIEVVLDSLTQVEDDTVAQCRGDQNCEPKVTNYFLVEMIGEALSSPSKHHVQIDAEEGSQKSQSEDEELESNKKRMLEEYLINIIEYETPVRHCYYVKNELYTRYFAVNNSLNLMVYFGLYTILSKCNLLSLIQMIPFFRIITLNFKPNIFKPFSGDNEYHGNVARYNIKAATGSRKNKQILTWLYIQLVLISGLIILQLSFSIYNNLQTTSQENFQRNIFNTLCPNPSKDLDDDDAFDDEGYAYQNASSIASNQTTDHNECAMDWSYYLMSMTASIQSDDESQNKLIENESFTVQAVVLEFFFLLLSYQLMFVVSGQLKLVPAQQLDHPTSNDDQDFVSRDENTRSQQKLKNQIWKFVQTLLFVYFPYILIILLMYVSASFNGQVISDLLSSIYLWFGLKFIIDAKKLFSKNTKLLKPLRYYNTVVLFLLLLYQAPVFLCPSAVDINGYTDPEYISTEDCASIMEFQARNQSKSTYETKQPMSLYIILSHSIGLLKQNSVNMTILFIYFFTEVQYQLFQHPYFKEYVLKHYLLEKESDGKVRAFMFVERFHLQRLWNYKAIKEEVKLLHKILLRLNEQIAKSEFAKNLSGFAEYQKTYNVQPPAQEEESKGLLEEESKREDGEDDQAISQQSERSQLDKDVDDFVEKNSQTIDNVALANLEPNKPVIPLKILLTEVKLNLKKDIQNGDITLRELNEESLTAYLNGMCKNLEKYVYTKNRIDLYNKEGIGLAIALDKKDIEQQEEYQSLYYPVHNSEGASKTSKTQSVQEYLRMLNQQTINRQSFYKKVFKSFEDTLAIGAATSEHGGSAESKSSSDKPENIHKPQSQLAITQSDEISQDQDFNPSPMFYEITQKEEEDTVKNMTWSQKLSYYIRLYLWSHYVDHILFFNLKRTSSGTFTLKKPMLQDFGLLRLLEASILSRSYQLVIMAIVFNFVMNANLISLFVVLMVFGYSLLENPIPSQRFWKFFMAYMLTIISLKFLYQLPIFCGTPVYTFYSDKCNNEDLIPQVLAYRIDYIIGIHKFSGPTSYPKNEGVFRGILADVLLLMVLLLHKQYLSKIGAWNYVKMEPNIYQNPSYTLDPKGVGTQLDDIRTNNEKLDLLSELEYQTYVYQQSPWYMKAWINIKNFFLTIASFYGKVLPQYMHRRQKNIDARKRSEQPYMTHKYIKVKPGDDFFTPIFFILLIINIYTLIYWKNISGENKSASFGEATVSLDRFGTIQVIALLLILMLLLFERMLYRARYIDDRDTIGKFQTTFGQQTLTQNMTKTVRKSRPSGYRHTLTLKLFIYYALIILINVYLGFLIPQHQLAPMRQNPWLVFFYFFWSYYFYNSALQIKHGFPMQPYKQAFSNDTSTLTYYAWRTYKAIPFIWEMKVIIDWTVTSTCLDLQQWFKLDDAYNTLYYNEVQANQRKERPEFRSRELWEKVLQGFCFALLLIFVILAPIFLFSGINPIMVKNSIKSGSLTIDLELINTGNSYRVYENQASRIQALTLTDDTSWRLFFEPQNSMIDWQDMQKLQFNTYSDTQWTISPPSLKRFIIDFNNAARDKPPEAVILNFKAEWAFKRDNPVGKERTSGQNIIGLTKRDFQPIIKMLEADLAVPKSNSKLMLAQVEQPEESNFLQLRDDEPDQQLQQPFFDASMLMQPQFTSMQFYPPPMPMYDPNGYFYSGQPFQQQIQPQMQAQLTVEEPQNTTSNLLSDHEEIMHILAAEDKDTSYSVPPPEAPTTPVSPPIARAQISEQLQNDTRSISNVTYPVVQNVTEEAPTTNTTRNISVTSNGTISVPLKNGTNSSVVTSPTFELKEIDDPYSQLTIGQVTRRQTKTMLSIKDAFPKILHLNAKTEANPLAMTELHTNSSTNMTSIELQLNRQANSIYFWTFTLGLGDGRGGKNRTAYMRDTPGVFNSRNSQEDIEAENRAQKQTHSTSKIDKKLREKDKADLAKKKVLDEQNLVMLIYNEEVIGSFFGNALQLSVVGLYATIVIAIGRFIRIVFDRISQRVMYEELPNTKQLFEICEGIFIAQMEGDLVREKQLYDLLILMYRSPEALIKITGTRLNHREEDDSEQDYGSDFNKDRDSTLTITESSQSVSTVKRFQKSKNQGQSAIQKHENKKDQ